MRKRLLFVQSHYLHVALPVSARPFVLLAAALLNDPSLGKFPFRASDTYRVFGGRPCEGVSVSIRRAHEGVGDISATLPVFAESHSPDIFNGGRGCVGTVFGVTDYAPLAADAVFSTVRAGCEKSYGDTERQETKKMFHEHGSKKDVLAGVDMGG